MCVFFSLNFTDSYNLQTDGPKSRRLLGWTLLRDKNSGKKGLRFEEFYLCTKNARIFSFTSLDISDYLRFCIPQLTDQLKSVPCLNFSG